MEFREQGGFGSNVRLQTELVTAPPDTVSAYSQLVFNASPREIPPDQGGLFIPSTFSAAPPMQMANFGDAWGVSHAPYYQTSSGPPLDTSQSVYPAGYSPYLHPDPALRRYHI